MSDKNDNKSTDVVVKGKFSKSLSKSMEIELQEQLEELQEAYDFLASLAGSGHMDSDAVTRVMTPINHWFSEVLRRHSA